MGRSAAVKAGVRTDADSYSAVCEPVCEQMRTIILRCAGWCAGPVCGHFLVCLAGALAVRHFVWLVGWLGCWPLGDSIQPSFSHSFSLTFCLSVCLSLKLSLSV